MLWSTSQTWQENLAEKRMLEVMQLRLEHKDLDDMQRELGSLRERLLSMEPRSDLQG